TMVLCRSQAQEVMRRQGQLRDRLEQELVARLGRDLVMRHGPEAESQRLPQTVNLGFPGLDANALLIQLDLAGICASLGSACASGSTQPAPTLIAMKVRDDTLKSSLRFSLNMFTTEQMIDDAVDRIVPVIERSRVHEAPTL